MPPPSLRAPAKPAYNEPMTDGLAIGARGERAADTSDVALWRITCLFSLGAFLGLGLAAFAVGILPGDLQVRAELVAPDRSVIRELARAINFAGTWRVLLPATLAIFAVSAAARRYWWLWSMAFLGSAICEQAIKFLVGRPRPSGFSLGFPSGHTTAATVFSVILIYVLRHTRLRPATRVTLQCVAIATALLVGWARIVLRAHWPTDVLGGLLLGTACAAAALWWASAREAPEVERDPVAVSAASTIRS